MTNEFDSLMVQVRETSLRHATAEEMYVELCRRLLLDSLQHGATHIHLQCSPHELLLRYRVLDKLQLRGVLPIEAADGLFDAIKLKFRLDQFERRRPQDGRVAFLEEGNQKFIRASFVHASLGPSAVLRWEEVPDSTCLRIHELGLLPEQELALVQILQRRVGLVVISGSASSGRRTTGHAALLAARDAGKSVLSLEWE